MGHSVLKGERAAYGEQIVSAVMRQLEADYGRGLSEKNLRHMLRFAEAFPDEAIVSAARRQLSWTHCRTLIYIDDPLKRDFYLQMTTSEGAKAKLKHGLRFIGAPSMYATFRRNFSKLFSSSSPAANASTSMATGIGNSLPLSYLLPPDCVTPKRVQN
nr:DUF1016 N-terminal domain-containing protein [Methyloversatilis discipulorum]